MAKIVRYNGNLVPFASASLGTERTIFGEVTQADDITSQYTAEFLRGWGIVGPSDQPTLQDFNAVSYTHGQILSYLHQMGIAEYNADQVYYIGGLCNVAGVVYSSLIDTNAGNTPASSPSQWRELYAAATETLRGSVELATSAETTAGASSSLAVHPAGLAATLTATYKLPSGYFSGFALANNVTLPNTTIDVSEGSARDTTNTVNLDLTSTLRGILQAAGSWTAGDNQNKLDTGAKAISTWYHVFAIRKTSDGTGDILFSLSPTAPTMPSGYAGFRWIGAVFVQASGNIQQFINVGDQFAWKDINTDVIASGVAAGSVTVTLRVPTGVRASAKIDVLVRGENSVAYVRAVDSNAVTLGTTSAGSWVCGIGSNNDGSTSEAVAASTEVMTNTSGQVILQTLVGTGNVGYGISTKSYKVFR